MQNSKLGKATVNVTKHPNVRKQRAEMKNSISKKKDNDDNTQKQKTAKRKKKTRMEEILNKIRIEKKEQK